MVLLKREIKSLVRFLVHYIDLRNPAYFDFDKQSEQ